MNIKSLFSIKFSKKNVPENTSQVVQNTQPQKPTFTSFVTREPNPAHHGRNWVLYSIPIIVAVVALWYGGYIKLFALSSPYQTSDHVLDPACAPTDPNCYVNIPAIPDPTGHSGQILTNDGTNPTWADNNGGSITWGSTPSTNPDLSGVTGLGATDLKTLVYNILFPATPTITLLCGGFSSPCSAVAIARNSAYTDPGATANDSVDGNITSSMTHVTVGSWTGLSLNTSVAGTYSITYHVTDSHGVSTSQTRTITVNSDTSPGATLAGGTFEFGSNSHSLSCTATKNTNSISTIVLSTSSTNASITTNSGDPSYPSLVTSLSVPTSGSTTSCTRTVTTGNSGAGLGSSNFYPDGLYNLLVTDTASLTGSASATFTYENKIYYGLYEGTDGAIVSGAHDLTTIADNATLWNDVKNSLVGPTGTCGNTSGSTLSSGFRAAAGTSNQGRLLCTQTAGLAFTNNSSSASYYWYVAFPANNLPRGTESNFFEPGAATSTPATDTTSEGNVTMTSGACAANKAVAGVSDGGSVLCFYNSANSISSLSYVITFLHRRMQLFQNGAGVNIPYELYRSTSPVDPSTTQYFAVE